MPSEFIVSIVKSGIFAVLFVCLLFYILSDSKKREEKYQETIKTLSKDLEIVESIDANVKVIKNRVIGQIKIVRDKI